MKKIITYFSQIAWFNFILIVLCITTIFLLNNLDEYLSKIRDFVTALPFLFLLLISVMWAIKSEEKQLAKIIFGAVSGALLSGIVYYKFLDRIISWIEKKEEIIVDYAMITILVIALLLAISASNQKIKSEANEYKF